MATSKKNRVVLESKFPQTIRATRQAVATARDRALDSGEDAAERALDRLNNNRGYNLPTDVLQEKQGGTDGSIRYPHFFGRWFEYGTPTITPGPFMRPGHRAMRKRFIQEIGADWEGWIRRKARVRR